MLSGISSKSSAFFLDLIPQLVEGVLALLVPDKQYADLTAAYHPSHYPLLVREGVAQCAGMPACHKWMAAITANY